MSGLNLVPNEVVGWRIRPDWHNYTVVLVKRYGPNSSRAGQEYDTPVAYCAKLQHAAARIVQQAAAMEGQELQDRAALTGSVADAEALLKAVAKAEAAALEAVEKLEAQLNQAGIFRPKQLVHALGNNAPAADA